MTLLSNLELLPESFPEVSKVRAPILMYLSSIASLEEILAVFNQSVLSSFLSPYPAADSVSCLSYQYDGKIDLYVALSIFMLSPGVGGLLS
jgi:hypothetical protein